MPGVGGDGLRLVSSAPGSAFWFGDAGEGHRKEVLLPLCLCFGGSARVGLELSPRAGRLFSSVDLKKFLDFLFLTSYSSFFFFPLLVSVYTRTEKWCLSQKNNGSFLQKKRL